jgi:hypothetical protein
LESLKFLRNKKSLVFVLDDVNPVAAKILFTANLISPDHLKEELLKRRITALECPFAFEKPLRIFRPQ